MEDQIDKLKSGCDIIVGTPGRVIDMIERGHLKVDLIQTLILDEFDKALELGLAGIALTDHETVAGHMDANIYAKEIKEKNPDFKVALGTEIYLCETRDKKQQNYQN